MPTLYCPKCGYNLTALTENRCPECGEGFDPITLRTHLMMGISTRSVVMQLVLVPALIAVLIPVMLCGLIAVDNSGRGLVGIPVGIVLLLAITVVHAYPLSRKFVQTRTRQRGEINTPWVFRKVWPCCVLFTVVEAALAFGYFAGGCAVILMNMSFH